MITLSYSQTCFLIRNTEQAFQWSVLPQILKVSYQKNGWAVFGDCSFTQSTMTHIWQAAELDSPTQTLVCPDFDGQTKTLMGGTLGFVRSALYLCVPCRTMLEHDFFCIVSEGKHWATCCKLFRLWLKTTQTVGGCHGETRSTLKIYYTNAVLFSSLHRGEPMRSETNAVQLQRELIMALYGVCHSMVCFLSYKPPWKQAFFPKRLGPLWVKLWLLLDKYLHEQPLAK